MPLVHPCTHIIYAPKADKYATLRITQNLKSEKDANIMSKEYIPVATADTVYYKPETQEEFDQLMDIVKVGDMVYSKWVFSGLWYTVGLNDINDPTTICLFPNIIMEEPLPPLTRWGMARYDFLKSEKKFMAAGLGTIGLHKHCLEIQEQAENRKHSMMNAIRKDPTNRVTERDKAENPIAWVQRMNMFQARVHETICADLIYS
jgi:hypothetical protein